MNDQTIKDAVRERYGRIAKGDLQGCCSTETTVAEGYNTATSCCGTSSDCGGEATDSADLGLGCGRPTELAGIEPGTTVLDLGSGAGVDVFRASEKVGPTGRVIGVDMTPEMIERARANAAERRLENVEFRLGEIEQLPVQDGSVDLVISNCVINLAPDKGKVFDEILRVLKPGGRMVVSDIVTRGEMPEEVRQDVELWSGCVAGAMDRDAYLRLLRERGFREARVLTEQDYDYGKKADYAVLSATVEARK
ncbi:MAG: arsenite methyltransferase [Candidatus Latescibacteria bacterium]|nr:arsenite methyltransferase [Candidatus Latescibacterota bacterium]